MVILLMINKSLLNCKVPSKEEAKEIVVNVIARNFGKSFKVNISHDLRLNPEAENFLEE